MRQTGWDATVSQVTRGVTGVAAPIFDLRDNVLGSLSVTIGEDHVSRDRLEFIADRVVLCARIVTKTIARSSSAPPLSEARRSGASSALAATAKSDIKLL